MLFGALLLAPLASAAAVVVQNNEPLVDLGYAKYHGIRLPSKVDQFLGVRYAKAPLGDLRFRGPQEPDVVDGIQDGTKVICVPAIMTCFFGKG